MKHIKKYLLGIAAMAAIMLTPFVAGAQETSLGESMVNFMNDTGFAKLADGNWLCLVMIGISVVAPDCVRHVVDQPARSRDVPPGIV